MAQLAEMEKTIPGKWSLIVKLRSSLTMRRKFKCMKRATVNGFDLIKQLCGSGADALLLLDCFMPSRFHDKAEWPENRGNIEIITRGELYQNHFGKTEHTEGDFTRAMCVSLKGWLKRTQKPSNRSRAPRSIPEVMAKNTAMNFNPVRVWLEQPKGGSKKIVKRIKIDPGKMRETGKIEFGSYMIQGQEDGDEDAARGQPEAASAADKPNDDDDDDDDDSDDEAVDMRSPPNTENSGGDEDHQPGDGEGEGGSLFVSQ